MNKLGHLSEDELLQFSDREIPLAEAATVERHLFTCRHCAERLRRMTNASIAYKQFQEEVLEPFFDVSGPEWRSSRQPAAATSFRALTQSLLAKRSNRWVLVAAAAFLCVLAVALGYLRKHMEPSAEQVLTRAEAADYRTAGTIVFATSQYRFTRPAVLQTGIPDARFKHTQALFVEADYSWDAPLKAHSFAAWRKKLHRKRDEVTSVLEPGGLKLYRVKTHTPEGVLRSASLTLKAETYQATKASFEFEGESPIQLTQEPDIPVENQNQNDKPNIAINEQPRVRKAESKATPDEELLVFAALEGIGADAGDPIDVRLDPQHQSIVVTGMGLSAVRREEIGRALSGIPAVSLEFTSHSPLTPDSHSAVTQPDSLGDSPNMRFRQKLAVPFGSIPQLEAATDKALDASNALFARAHSLQVLAREFPPVVEAKLGASGEFQLTHLRTIEADSMALSFHRLNDELTPLTAGHSIDNQAVIMPTSNWQSSASTLFEDTRNLDALLSRLLAGTCTEEIGDNLIKQLPADLSKVGSYLRAVSSDGK